MSDYGLLGKTLVHSYSKELHEAFGMYSYELFERSEQELPAFFAENWKGINVTIPYKQSVLAYCDELAPKAARIGCANTIVRTKDGKLVAHNTDYHGFSHMAEEAGIDFGGKKVAILGSGGAAKTCKAAIEDFGGSVRIISRCGKESYGDLGKFYDCEILINATPVGTFPNVEEKPLDLRPFEKLQAVLDLTYNPATTALMFQAQNLGIKTAGGLSMLVWQAARACELFTGCAPEPEKVRKILRKLELKKKNIFLVGMPGCGKSTVGKILAEKLGREFIDADEACAKLYGKSPAEIIESRGEKAFRLFESSVLFELGKKQGVVAACGGGACTVPENYESIKRNSVCVWVQRNLGELATDGRPLSFGKDLGQLYIERRLGYAHFSDFEVHNNASPVRCADEIIAKLEAEKWK